MQVSEGRRRIFCGIVSASGGGEANIPTLFRATSSGALRRCSDLPGLPAEHGPLTGEPPVIAGELAGFADYAVARHHERHRVLADRGADGAGGFWRADLSGDVRIGD